MNRNVITNFDELCAYDIQSGLKPGNWQLLNTNGLLYNTTGGGSCVHDGFLYTFFGLNFVDGVPQSDNKIARIDLNDVESGWKLLGVEGCSDRLTKRDSFGYYYTDGSVYINGGLQGDKVMNSMLRLDINNSNSVISCTVLQDQTDWPNRRYGASMVYAKGGFYLYGGKEKTIIFDDLWYFDLSNLIWNYVISYGDIPGTRYKHSSASEGKYMLISGGLGKNDILLDDHYLLEIETSRWIKIAASSEVNPPAMYSSCIALKLPKVYLVGGVEDSHITNSLWEYDISTNLFTKLYSYKPGDTGFNGHSCSFDIGTYGEKLLTVYFGSKTMLDVPNCAFTQYNLSSAQIKPKIIPYSGLNFPCRCHSSDHLLDSNYLLIAGGVRYQQEFFNDIWLVDRHTFQTYLIGQMQESLYYSASSFFNNTLFIFSGFSTNGLSVNFPSSDYTIEIEMRNLKISVPNLDLRCGLGMEVVNGVCEFCKIGYYNPNSNSSICLSCPKGTFSENRGSDSIYQCIPCPADTFSIHPGTECIECPEDRKCYIGTSDNSLSESQAHDVEHFGEHKDQPELYEPAHILQIKAILWLTVFGIIILFGIAFAFSYRLRTFISYYDIYKNSHRERICDVNGNLIERKQTTGPSKLGGFLSVVAGLILLALSIESVITYVKTNEQEKVVMVPIDTLIDKEEFDSQTLRATLLMSSYRGECSFKYLTFTHSEHIEIEDRSIEQSHPYCKIYYKMKLKDIIETGDYIKFYFDDPEAYTSDISIRLKTFSSIPGQDSIVSQHLNADSEKVFRGTYESEFYFSFLPAYYREANSFHEFSKLGYVLSISNSSSKGTQADPRELGIYSGLGIKINLMRVEFGITTFKYEKKELMDYMLKFMTDFPGTLVMLGFLLWFYEAIYKACKGKYSGRRVLVKKLIKEERERRNGE